LIFWNPSFALAGREIYTEEGITNIQSNKVKWVNPLDEFSSLLEIIYEFGSTEKHLQALSAL
jgi:hypothetical protein